MRKIQETNVKNCYTNHIECTGKGNSVKCIVGHFTTEDNSNHLMVMNANDISIEKDFNSCRIEGDEMDSIIICSKETF